MPDECDACVNPAKCGAEGRCAEYDSPLQPHTGRPRDASHPDAGQWGHPSQRPSVFDSEPASPPHTGGPTRVAYEIDGHPVTEAQFKAAIPASPYALHEPAQPQPREPKRECVHEWCPHRCSAYCRDPKGAQPQPRGEGDDLAARLEGMAANPGHSWPVVSGVLREAASALRASTHPEQSARVSEDDLYVLTKFQRIMRSANRQHEVEAVDRILAALEPASPAPTEQGEDQ